MSSASLKTSDGPERRCYRAGMFRFVALALLVLLTGCLQPIRRYSLSAPSSQLSREERLQELGRAMVAAGHEVEELDPTLSFVATQWHAPFGNDWRRRFVAVLDTSGSVTLRVEVKICRLFQPCVPLKDEVASQDLEALEALAMELSRVTQTTATVIPR